MADLDSVGVVILAAGSSRRLGRPKQLLDLDGKPLLQHVVDVAGLAGVGDLVVVLGHVADKVMGAIKLPPIARFVVNLDHVTGQASSLRAGLGALGPGIDRAVILLGDQPRIAVEAIRDVAVGPGPIRRTRYRDAPGHPIAFDRVVWDHLMAIDGDRGARDLMAAHPELIHDIARDAPLPSDVDTSADATEIGSSG